ncbi:MAG TPA: glycosyltransferase N-terminal domain-containing protein, partial [Blastocatellia bacterium]|nr:glycosyltransferase N-terminal domain-containing protein [Blastocatellia bacterium]
MYLLYSLALSTVFLLLSPYFLYQALKNGKYAPGFLQRLGIYSSDGLPTSSTKPIWVHAVSVGEFLTALPLIRALKHELPGRQLVVTTTTLSGQRLARDRLTDEQSVSAILYFPFDWTFTVNRALNRVDPAAVIILETELWPNFFRRCHTRNVPVFLVNGRISARSFKRYRLIRAFMARVLAHLSLALMQSADDAERITALGADPKSVRICGNLKHDAVPLTSGTSSLEAHRPAHDRTGSPNLLPARSRD